MSTARAGASSSASPASLPTRDDASGRDEAWPSDEEEDASYSERDDSARSGSASASPHSGPPASDEDGEYESDEEYYETGSEHSSDQSASPSPSPSPNRGVPRSSAPPASSPTRPPVTPAPAADLSSIIAFLTHVLGSQHQLAPEEHASLRRFWLALVQRLDAQQAQAQARLALAPASSPAARSSTPRPRRQPTPAAIQPPATVNIELPMGDMLPSDAHLTSLLQRLLEQQPAPSAPSQPPPPATRSSSHDGQPVPVREKPSAPVGAERANTAGITLPPLLPLPPIPPIMSSSGGVLRPLVPPMGVSSPPPPSGGVGQPFALMDLESDDEQDPDFDPLQVDPQFDQAGQEDWLWDPQDLQQDLAALMEDVPAAVQPSDTDISRALAMVTTPQPSRESQSDTKEGEKQEAPAQPPIPPKRRGRPRKYATKEETIAAQRSLTRARRREEKLAVDNLKRELSETKAQLAESRKEAALQASHVQRLAMDNILLLDQLGGMHRYLATIPPPPEGLIPASLGPGLPPLPIPRRRRADSPPTPTTTRNKRTRCQA